MVYAGTVESTEVIEPHEEVFYGGRRFHDPGGILLRPTEDWTAPFLVFEELMLELPDGRFFSPKLRGGAHTGPYPRPIMIELIPAIDNHVPKGTKVYVSYEVAERAGRCVAPPR